MVKTPEKTTALGAHAYVNLREQSAVDFLQDLGGADLIVSTISHGKTVSEIAKGLKAQGKLLLLGAGGDLLVLPLNCLVGKAQQVQGSLTGTPFDAERTLNFSLLTGVRPQIETFPLAQANDALARLQAGKARFRIVLKIN